VAPVRYGYTFDSWYADAELTEKYVFTTMPLNGATVYAKWISANEGRSDSEYHINGITLRSGSTNLPVGAIPEGSFYAEVSFTNRTSDHMDMLVLATYTAEGKLLDMYFLYTCPQKGQTAVMGVLLDHDKGQIGEVKAFILTGFNGTQPLANSVSVGK